MGQRAQRFASPFVRTVVLVVICSCSMTRSAFAVDFLRGDANADGRVSIAELDVDVQAKLLRVLSDGSYRRVGDHEEWSLDVRFLFSTAQDIDEAVRAGTLREDFVHRVRVLEVTMPPLRERVEDLEDLAGEIFRELDRPPPRVGRSVPATCFPRATFLPNFCARTRSRLPRSNSSASTSSGSSTMRTATRTQSHASSESAASSSTADFGSSAFGFERSESVAAEVL